MKVKLVKVTDCTVEEQMEMLKWRNHPETAKYFLLQHIDEDTHRNWLERQKEEKPSTVAFFIDVDGVKIGVVYVHSIDYVNGTGMEGTFLKPNVIEKYPGVIVVASYLLREYYFNTLKMHKLNGEVLGNNARALNFTKQLGFVLEGVQKEQYYKDGQYIDLHLLGMFKQDWEKTAKKIYSYVRMFI